MKAVVAIDSFKGSLSTFEAGEAAKVGILRAVPRAKVEIVPLADGGEGTVDAIMAATDGLRRTVTVKGPLATAVDATYGVIPATKTAVIEMSAAAGITLIPPEARDPMRTTTYGVGELILDALDVGCRDFVIGIGGSATNDGGIGMLTALGVRFFNSRGEQVWRGAAALADIADISLAEMHPALADCRFRVASDVKNPLCGKLGCSAVFGPQKGASPETVAKMDGYMAHYATRTRAVIPTADDQAAGAGAAGGLGFAFVTYLGATLQSGASLVIKETDLENKIKTADVVATGEGRLDGQSSMGKAPIGVASLAKKYGKPVIAFAGCVTADAVACHPHGIDAFFPILRTPCTLEEAMNKQNAEKNLADTAEQAFRLFALKTNQN